MLLSSYTHTLILQMTKESPDQLQDLPEVSDNKRQSLRNRRRYIKSQATLTWPRHPSLDVTSLPPGSWPPTDSLAKQHNILHLLGNCQNISKSRSSYDFSQPHSHQMTHVMRNLLFAADKIQQQYNALA